MLAALVLALGVLPGWAAAGTTAGPGPYRVQMVYRVGRSVAPFNITVHAGGNDDYGLWFFVELRRDAKGRWYDPDTDHAIADGGGTPYPTAYGTPAGTYACSNAALCQYPVDLDASALLDVRPTARSAYFIVSMNTRIRIDVDSSAWRVKDVPNPGIHRVTPEDGGATGVRTTGEAVEHFTAAAAPGGRYGSTVFASLPCTRSGTGSARLTARGADSHVLRCSATSGIGSFWFATTRVATTWRLAGDVYGTGGGLSRLFVLDLPKP